MGVTAINEQGKSVGVNQKLATRCLLRTVLAKDGTKISLGGMFQVKVTCHVAGKSFFESRIVLGHGNKCSWFDLQWGRLHGWC